MTRKTKGLGHSGTLKALFICILALLCLAVPVTLSRFLDGDADGDNAQVAYFEILQSGTLTKTITPVFGSVWTYTYDITLENNSEVDVTYTVSVVRSTENLPLSFTWSDGTNTGTLKANGDTVTKTLTIAWDGARDVKFSGEMDPLNVTVTCEQLD